MSEYKIVLPPDLQGKITEAQLEKQLQGEGKDKKLPTVTLIVSENGATVLKPTAEQSGNNVTTVEFTQVQILERQSTLRIIGKIALICTIVFPLLVLIWDLITVCCVKNKFGQTKRLFSFSSKVNYVLANAGYHEIVNALKMKVVVEGIPDGKENLKSSIGGNDASGASSNQKEPKAEKSAEDIVRALLDGVLANVNPTTVEKPAPVIPAAPAPVAAPTNIPVPPPMPVQPAKIPPAPTAPTATTPPTKAPEALLKAIQAGTKLKTLESQKENIKPVVPPESQKIQPVVPPESQKSSALLAAIQKGTQLKKVNPQEGAKVSPKAAAPKQKGAGDLQDDLFNAIRQRAAAMKGKGKSASSNASSDGSFA